jgi:hypothetical protein
VAERELSSRSSDHVRYLRSLHKRAGRSEHARLLVEGPAALTLLLSDPRPVEVFDVLLEADRHPELERLVLEHRDNVSWISEEVSRALSETEHPQGAFAEVALPSHTAPRIMEGSGPVVICDGIGDPGNAGTIIRTAHAVGASGVIFLSGSVDPFNGKAVRSAAALDPKPPPSAARRPRPVPPRPVPLISARGCMWASARAPCSGPPHLRQDSVTSFGFCHCCMGTRFPGAGLRVDSRKIWPQNMLKKCDFLEMHAKFFFSQHAEHSSNVIAVNL